MTNERGPIYRPDPEKFREARERVERRNRELERERNLAYLSESIKERDLVEDLARMIDATPRPWTVEETSGDAYVLDAEDNIVGAFSRPEDAEFVAAAREALPYAIRRVFELEAELEQIKRGMVVEQADAIPFQRVVLVLEGNKGKITYTIDPFKALELAEKLANAAHKTLGSGVVWKCYIDGEDGGS